MDHREDIQRIFMKQRQIKYIWSYIDPYNFIQLLDEKEHFSVSLKMYCNIALSFYNFSCFL